MNLDHIVSSKMKLKDFVEKENKCIFTRFARLACAEHAGPRVRDEPVTFHHRMETNRNTNGCSKLS